MPATPAVECLCDELDDLGTAKVRYLRVVETAIQDGVVTEEERRQITVERGALKRQFRIARRRAGRMASGNRLPRLLANTGEITPKAERLFRELTTDEARIVAFPADDPDDPTTGGAALAA